MRKRMTAVAALAVAGVLAPIGAWLTLEDAARPKESAVRPAVPRRQRSRGSASPSERAAAIASTTLAASRSSFEAPPDEVDEAEAEARALLGRQLIAWLAIEDDPDAALIEARQVAALAPWLRPGDVRALEALATSDGLEARRRAAVVALGR